jgi:hypothetical protein
MALLAMTTTVNTQNGATINTFAIGNGDSIKAVVLRKKMCAGAYMLRQENLSLTIPDGTQTTFTLTAGVGPEPIGTQRYSSRPPATMVVQQGGGVEEENWVEGVNFTITGRVITFIPNFVGTNKVATISYSYYDPSAANLVYDAPVYPSNTKGVIKLGGYDLVVWNEGILAQEVKSWVTAGTANGVIEALVTDA